MRLVIKKWPLREFLIMGLNLATFQFVDMINEIVRRNSEENFIYPRSYNR